MINSDFTENFNRTENIIRTNEEQVVIDRDGYIIFTTPFILDETIVDDRSSFADQNIAPENVNIIIDSITLLSTNPRCQNYLPLKIELGTKQEIDFSTCLFSALERYRVIVDPPVNLNTIRNKSYTNPKTFSMLVADPTQPISVVKTERSGDTVYVSYTTQPEGSGTRNIQNISWIKFDSPYPSATTRGVISLPASISTGRWLEIEANTEQVVAIGTSVPFDNPPPVSIFSNASIWDLSDTTVAPVLVDTLPVDDRYVNHFVIGSSLFYFSLSVTNSISVRVYVKYTDVVPPIDNYDLIFIQENVFTLQAGSTNQRLSRYGANQFFLVDQIQTGALDVGGNSTILTEINYNSLNSEFVTVYRSSLSATLDTKLPIVFDFYIGGSDIKDPLITVFVFTGGTRRISIRQSRWSTATVYDIDTDIPVKATRRSLRNRDRNQVVYMGSTGGKVQCVNLDNDKRTEFNTVNMLSGTSITPARNFQSALSADSGFVVVGTNNVGLENRLILTNFPNERPVDKVYSLSCSYTEKVFPYQISGNRFTFKVKLPNDTPIKDMEIFKYVIDWRLRFTIAQRELLDKPTAEDPNVPPVPIDEMENCIDECDGGTNAPIADKPKEGECGDGKCSMDTACDPKDPKCNSCFKRCTKNLGSVGRVLGYVDSDFSVVDFLNIYKSV